MVGNDTTEFLSQNEPMAAEFAVSHFGMSSMSRKRAHVLEQRGGRNMSKNRWATTLVKTKEEANDEIRAKWDTARRKFLEAMSTLDENEMRAVLRTVCDRPGFGSKRFGTFITKIPRTIFSQSFYIYSKSGNKIVCKTKPYFPKPEKPARVEEAAEESSSLSDGSDFKLPEYPDEGVVESVFEEIPDVPEEEDVVRKERTIRTSLTAFRKQAVTLRERAIFYEGFRRGVEARING